MIKKFKVSEIARLISDSFSLEQIRKQLEPIGEKVGISFTSRETGSGYFQWILPDGNWRSFADVDEDQKRIMAKVYEDKMSEIKMLLSSVPFKDDILTVPNESCIYFSSHDNSYEIALAAWGYRSLKQSPCSDLTKWISQTEYQRVRIGFTWDNEKLSNCTFFLNGQKRITSDDGYFNVDREVPVGDNYPIATISEEKFSLKVEKGKSDYIYDLTKRFYIEIQIKKDGMPVPNTSCSVTFNKTDKLLTTDEQGRIVFNIPLSHTTDGDIEKPQPSCVVTYNDEQQEQKPTEEGCRLLFLFTSNTKEEKIEEPVPEKKNEDIVVEPTPHQPELVEIKLLDYEGFPLIDLDFILITKKKGEIKLKTDKNGVCTIPKEWFTNKEKMRVKYTISPEYQQTHDIHDKKKKKNK